MSKSKGHRREWRNSKLPTRPAPTNQPNGTTQKRVQVKHEATQNDHPITGDHSSRPVVPRILTGCAPPTRPAPPHMPAHSEAQPPPSALRKRGADPGSSALAPAPKRPALKRSRSYLALSDGAMARRGKTNEVTFSAMTGQEHSQAAGDLNTHAPGMSKAPESTSCKQIFTFGTSAFESKYDKNVASARKPDTGVLTTRPHTEPTTGAHRTDRLFKFDLGPRAAGSRCRACGSEWHMTRDCHVPSQDGTVTICPFHDCSAIHPIGKGLPGHSLDGLSTRNQTRKKSKDSSHCPLIISYKEAARAQDREKMRYLLPQMFGELVLSRKRKPFCRVLNKVVCPINITIEFSREFCHGQMPSGLEEVWPYTMRDATDPAVREKLQQYDELGWQGMPPGELEGKPWDQLKQEYLEGVIPPQVHMTHKQRREYHAALDEVAASATGGKEGDQRGQDADLMTQSLDEGDCSKNVGEEQDESQLQSENTALMDEVLRLSAKVDNMAETLNHLKGRQKGAEPKAEPSFSPSGTRSDPIDIDMNGQSIRWRVE